MPMSTELQRFYYYHGKNTKCGNTIHQHHLRLSFHLDQTQLGSTKPNKSPTWRLIQSPTSIVILQKQSLIPTTHPPILKLEDQLKLHIASASQ